MEPQKGPPPVGRRTGEKPAGTGSSQGSQAAGMAGSPTEKPKLPPIAGVRPRTDETPPVELTSEIGLLPVGAETASGDVPPAEKAGLGAAKPEPKAAPRQARHITLEKINAAFGNSEIRVAYQTNGAPGLGGYAITVPENLPKEILLAGLKKCGITGDDLRNKDPKARIRLEHAAYHWEVPYDTMLAAVMQDYGINPDKAKTILATPAKRDAFLKTTLFRDPSLEKPVFDRRPGFEDATITPIENDPARGFIIAGFSTQPIKGRDDREVLFPNEIKDKVKVIGHGPRTYIIPEAVMHRRLNIVTEGQIWR